MLGGSCHWGVRSRQATTRGDGAQRCVEVALVEPRQARAEAVAADLAACHHAAQRAVSDAEILGRLGLDSQ